MFIKFFKFVKCYVLEYLLSYFMMVDGEEEIFIFFIYVVFELQSMKYIFFNKFMML